MEKFGPPKNFRVAPPMLGSKIKKFGVYFKNVFLGILGGAIAPLPPLATPMLLTKCSPVGRPR